MVAALMLSNNEFNDFEVYMEKIMTLTKYGFYGALAASMALAMPAYATLQIDDFTDPNGAGNSAEDLTVGGGGMGSTYDTTTVLGGERDLYVELLQLGNSATSGVEMSVNSGSLTYETGSGAIGMGSIQYDGDDNDAQNVDIDGLGSVDFTVNGGSAFILDVLESDIGFNFAINV